MDNHLLIILAIIAGLIIIAPYIISWRISKLGTAVVSDSAFSGEPVLSTWATIKGKGAFSKSSILCRCMLYSDRMGLRLLWGPQRFIKLADIGSIDRLLKGPRTTALRFKPREKGSLQQLMISGIVDIPKFLAHAKSAGIEVKEMDDDRGMFDYLR